MTMTMSVSPPKRLIGALAIGLSFLIGCSGNDDGASGREVTVGKDAGRGVELGAPEKARDESSGSKYRLTFGETYLGHRGDITVTEPSVWDPPDWQRTPEGKRWVVVTVTVENKSKRVLRGYDWMFGATANGRNTYASTLGVSAPDILPGDSGIWKVTFKLPETRADVVFSVEYGIFLPTYWTGAV